MARMNQREEELILDTVNHMLKCVRYMSELYTLELNDLGKLDTLANKLADTFGDKWVRDNWYANYEVSNQKEFNLDNISKLHQSSH